MRRATDWFEQAKGDLKAAKDLYSTENYAWCCFACHQAAEKALKAILEFFGSPTAGHSLIALAGEVSRFTTVPKEVGNASRILNRLYIPTRYPNAFPSGAPIHMFDKSDADEALSHAEGILNYAREVTGLT